MEGSTTEGHVVGIPVSNRAYAIEEPDLNYGIEEPEFQVEETPDHGGFSSSFQSSYGESRHTCSLSARFRNTYWKVVEDTPHSKGDFWGKWTEVACFDVFAVTLGPKLADMVKGKLKLGAKIIQAGGVEKMFRQWFSVDKNEKLLRYSQCYLSTTAGPIAGLLFVSTARVAFRSDRSLAVSSSRGDTARVPYKVTIPLRKVKAVRPSENKHRPEQKYVHLVTNDGFEFWFLGFVSYNRSLQHLEQAVAYAQQAQ
ncbi:hypothetical protein HU200_007403 [Digitaria exilis]|uniref:GRAM domain-containing protein n=1 Tax=Digitaria exilis TaxID=1010633 RepID=A0A835FMU8_9POAL|nr:hypothetical protein HU200_007403 [Digitaria exilis]